MLLPGSGERGRAELEADRRGRFRPHRGPRERMISSSRPVPSIPRQPWMIPGVFARGFGIGFYTAAGKVSSDGSESGTVGGGFGYSQNNSGAEEKPWLQGLAGVLN